MTRIFIPATGLESWKARLADPEKHWKRTASAFEAAVSWELAARTGRGIPAEIAALLDPQEALRDASLLFAFPEHKVALPGGSRASQTDVWTVLKGGDGLISMGVEAKAEESFGETLEEWNKDDSAGKAKRLGYLEEVLQVKASFPATIRYQLLHRTASAIIEARRIGARHAVMMVQSFRQPSPSEADFKAFGTCFSVDVAPGTLVRIDRIPDVTLYLGWASSPLCTDAEIARVSV